MPVVKIHMTVNNQHARWYGDHSSLWHKNLHMTVVPQAGEKIELWEDGPMIEVKERWFNHRGIAFCDLRACVIDPDADEQRYQSHDLRPTNWSWFTQSDGALLSKLLEGGWVADA